MSVNPATINWTNPKTKLTPYFTVKDALWLPAWSRLATEKDGLTLQIKTNLLDLFWTMTKVRDLLGQPIDIHCAYRPALYNTLVKGAKRSAHTEGKACDWSSDLYGSCDDIRTLLVPHLEALGLRCEDLPRSDWVHLDRRVVAAGGRRFFKP